MTTRLNDDARARIEAKLNSEQYAAIPEMTRHALRRYLFDHLQPGHTLRSLLNGNDTVRTVLSYQDDQPGLLALCMFLHWEVPHFVHGSPDNVDAWLRLVEQVPLWCGTQDYDDDDEDDSA